MTRTRSVLAASALLSFLGMPAHAQQWGGSPPATSSRNPAYGRSIHEAHQTWVALPYNTLVDRNAYAFVFGAGQGQPAAATAGGSWNGRWTRWGAGAPAQAQTNQQVGTSTTGIAAPNQRHAPIAAAESPVPSADMTAAQPTPAPLRAQSRAQLTRAQQYLRERQRP